MIRISGLTKRFGGRTVLQDVNLELPSGAFAFLQGCSGSGKSTLLKLLYRDMEADAGSIEVEGTAIAKLPKYVLRRKIGVVFQSFELLERKTVLENIALAGEVQGRSRSEFEPEAFRLLERVGLLGLEHVYPSQLSGGEQQRVAIVRALLNRPALLLADEPTGNLDGETAAAIMNLLKELHEEERTTMLIVTHSDKWVQSVPSYSARKLWMENGRVHEYADSI